MLARAREKGLDWRELVRLGEEQERPEYVAAGWFLDQYLDRPGLTRRRRLRRPDPAGRVHGRRAPGPSSASATGTSSSTSTRTPTRARSRWSSTWPATDGTSSSSAIPHQSIYAFRGAEVRGILDFPPAVPARRRRACGRGGARHDPAVRPELLQATRRIAASVCRSPAGCRPRRRRRSCSPSRTRGAAARDASRCSPRHRPSRGRAPRRPAAARTPPGRRRLVGHGGAGPLRAAVDPAAAPLAGCGRGAGRGRGRRQPAGPEPAVQVLVSALSAVLHLDDERPGATRIRRPGPGRGAARPPRSADSTSPTCACWLAPGVRRTRDPGGRRGPDPARGSPELLPRRGRGIRADCVGRCGPAGPWARPPHWRDSFGRPGTCCSPAARPRRCCGTLWSGTTWPGGCGPRRRVAAVRRPVRPTATWTRCCALFDEAARVEEHRGHTGLESFLATLAAQQIPADTLAEQGVRGDAVRLLTAHRSKGLEWRLVVVAHVQEDGWPDLRRRATLLQARPDRDPRPGRADHDQVAARRRAPAVLRRVHPGPGAAGRDSGRVHRRRRRAAVAVPGRARARRRAVEHHAARPERPLSLDGTGRRAATDRRRPAGARSAAASRSAPAGRLSGPTCTGAARRGSRGGPGDLVGPARRLALRATRSATPSEPVRISASTLIALETCPAQWFLTRRPGRSGSSTQARGSATSRTRSRTGSVAAS